MIFRNTASILGTCLISAVISGCHSHTDIHMEIPAGFEGGITLSESPECPAPEYKDGRYIYTIDGDGEVCFSTLDPFREWHQLTGRFSDGTPIAGTIVKEDSTWVLEERSSDEDGQLHLFLYRREPHLEERPEDRRGQGSQHPETASQDEKVVADVLREGHVHDLNELRTYFNLYVLMGNRLPQPPFNHAYEKLADDPELGEPVRRASRNLLRLRDRWPNLIVYEVNEAGDEFVLQFRDLQARLEPGEPEAPDSGQKNR